uniref:UN2 n=1 Tax=Kamese virus TaxID=200402 RepID=A0A1V0QSV8_9RHAB|nr:UN2 [Kamese virus]
MNLAISGSVKFVLPRESFTRRNLWLIQKASTTEYRRRAGITQDVAGMVCSFLFSKIKFRLTEEDKIECIGMACTYVMFPARFHNVFRLHIQLRDGRFTMVIDGKAIGVALSASLNTRNTMDGIRYEQEWGEAYYPYSPSGRTLEQDAKRFGFEYLFDMVQTPRVPN